MKRLTKLLKFIRWRLHVGVFLNNFSKKIRGVNNLIKISSDAISRSKITIVGSNNSVHIENSRFLRNLEIRILGDDNHVFIGNSTWIKNSQILIEGDTNLCSIGAQCTIEGAEIFLTEKNTKLVIGEDCMFADSIVFRTGDSHSIYDSATGLRLNSASNIEIGSHVWVAQGVTILKRSVVPSGSVVAAKSLVNKKFDEPNILIAGIPAKKIKTGIVWARER
jgi:acetyltransferase-like isoleucine patch superfamily enzyme